jgi:hypothetical protein
LSPINGIETRILERLRATVATLPAGAAELYTGRDSVSQSPFPYFRVTPSNPRSAVIRGFVIDDQGIDFTIGHATGGEVVITREGGNRGKRREDWFFRVCHAVFTVHFSEKLIYSAGGRVIYSRIELEVDGRKVHIGGHQICWWLFPRRAAKCFSYGPYY